jgi:hypothetical protein
MTEERAEIAAHVPRPGMAAVRLFGGPWDGKEIGVHNPQARIIKVNGPRNGNHRVWITHLYVLKDGRLEFARTDIFCIETTEQQ